MFESPQPFYSSLHCCGVETFVLYKLEIVILSLKEGKIFIVAATHLYWNPLKEATQLTELKEFEHGVSSLFMVKIFCAPSFPLFRE